jgi:N-acetylgalactosamine-N,N'-diacetylbacillosaminyl-diphospho-undecaprenol 4-alpha-N-acetylgalactosaminyltransferase
MKKIAFLVNTMGDGGAQKVISILLEYLVKHYSSKYKLYLILMENNIKYKFDKQITIKILNKQQKSNLKKLFEIPSEAYKLKKYIQENNIDVVYSMLYRANYLNIVAKLFGSKHRCLIGIRSSTSRYFNEGIKGKVNLSLIWFLYRYTDIIISNSQGVKKDFEKIYKFKNKHIVIYNAFKPCECFENKQNLFFKKNRKYIIAIGRMVALKRFEDLIRAYSKSNLVSSYDLLFLGEGKEKKRLIELASELNLSTHIHFIGNVTNPYCFLKKSEIFVLSSEIEGFPNVLVEAMLCKKIVVSSNCKSGPSEILQNGKIGFLYEVANVNELLYKLNYISKLSKNKKEKLIKDIYNRANEFKVEQIIGGLLRIFDEKNY